MRLAVLLLVPVIAGCSNSIPAPPADIREPEAVLMAQPMRLAMLPADARGNAAMWESYGQCRLSHASEADKRLGLIAYVQAIRGRSR